MYTTWSDSELAILIYWTDKSMNNLLSYCGLVVARISASEKDLPVKRPFFRPNHSIPHGCIYTVAF